MAKTTKILHYNLDIAPQDKAAHSASSILNTKSDEFSSFEGSLVRMLDAAGYYLYSQYDSDHILHISKHYKFRTSSGRLKIKLILIINIHGQKADVIGKPIDVDIDIAFDGQHFVSYYEALEHINKLVNTKLK